MERPNLGKPVSPAMLNNLPDASVALPKNSSYPKVASAVLSTPRQLAPSVGNVAKGVTIMGEAKRGAENFVFGQITVNEQGESIVDDFGWWPESDLLESGDVIPIGKFNVFVGMITTRSASDGDYESVSGAATIVQSDGEESVGTAEADGVLNTLEERLDDPAGIPGDAVERAGSESILPLFEGRFGYDVEEEDDEEQESSPSPVRRVAVYTAPSSSMQPSPSAVVPPAFTPGQQQLPPILELAEQRVDGEPASVSEESEGTARYRNSFGFLHNRAQGEERSNIAAAPALFNNGLVLDPSALTRLVTPENAAVRAMELDTARRALEQMRRDAEAERQEIEARKKQIEEEENRLNEATRAHRRRHQSRLGLGENIANPEFPFRGEESFSFEDNRALFQVARGTLPLLNRI